jgi:hypothetical protein
VGNVTEVVGPMATVTDFAPVEPLLPAASVCVAVNEYVPGVAIVGDVVDVQAPAVQVAEPDWDDVPVTVTLTGPSPVVHAPPTELIAGPVVSGNVTVTPITWVRVTTGGVVSIVTDLAPLDPVLPAASVCVAVKLYVPCAEMVGDVVYVQAPAVHVPEPDCDDVPVTVTLTGPSPVVQAPPTVETAAFVENGNVTTAPFTRASVTAGAVVSNVNVVPPVVVWWPVSSVARAVAT